jgi:hypothetical protein
VDPRHCGYAARDPVFAEVRDGSSVVGCFHSLIIRRFGFKILASPVPGLEADFF